MNNVLFEIGIEELPARFIDNGEKQLKEKTENWLKELRINFDNIISYSTPRRLAIVIEGIAACQTSITEELRGPQISVAKDQEGNWTKAAIGFSKGQGKSTDDIYTKELDGKQYIFIKNEIEGKPTEQLLPLFSEIITSLHFPQAMRWGEGSFRFPRPIRWLVGLLNDTIIPFEVANVKSANITYGHRFLGTKIALDNPLRYQEKLNEQFVIVDPTIREDLIIKQIAELEKQANFKVAIDSDLLNEVRNLVEYPTAFYGSFNEDYLALPSEVLITSMQEHQRYFPVKALSGELLPYFVGVRNGNDEMLENVVAGNEKVLRARLADGVFFYEEDKKNDIEFYLEKLKTVVFQVKIGTVYEKLENIEKISAQIADQLLVEPVVSGQVTRTAQICKFDLMTNMVGEFTELQGIIGEYYALYFNEDKVVAHAIKEHYYPTQSNGKLAETIPGAIVGVADKLDTIVGSISVGLIPTGSQDPYSLRRQAIGVLRTAAAHKWDITVEDLISKAVALYSIGDEEVSKRITTFFKNRAAHLLSLENIEQDVIGAVLHDEIGVFHYAVDKAKSLSNRRHDDDFKLTEQALVRVMNLGKKYEFTTVNQELFQTESEKELFKQYEKVAVKFQKYHDTFHAEESLNELTKLAGPINHFFEENMVMDDDKQVRQNRLAIIHRISSLVLQYADITQIEWKQSK